MNEDLFSFVIRESIFFVLNNNKKKNGDDDDGDGNDITYYIDLC